MSGALYTHTTRASGTILTAAIYNADHQNHITFGDAQYLGGWSNTVAQMRIQADPGESGSESLGSSISDEIERLRFAIYELKAAMDGSLLYWYQSPGDLAGSARLPSWYIDGLELSVNASSPGFIEVATGICRSNDDTINMRVSTPLNRTVTALWVTAATGGGVGVTWVKFKPYHVFVIKTSASTFDIGFDTVLTASNILARASGTKYRRIGSLFTATTAGTMRPIVQYGNEVFFQQPQLSNTTFIGSTVSGTNQFNQTIVCPALPSGVIFKVHIHSWVTSLGRWIFQDWGATYSFSAASAQYFGGNAALDQAAPHNTWIWSSVSGSILYSIGGCLDPIRFGTVGWMDNRK